MTLDKLLDDLKAEADATFTCNHSIRDAHRECFVMSGADSRVVSALVDVAKAASGSVRYCDCSVPRGKKCDHDLLGEAVDRLAKLAEAS